MVGFTVQDAEVNKFLNDAVKKVGDLRPAFIQIAREFYKSNKAIFKLQSKGKYEDFGGPKIKDTWKVPGRPDLRTRDGSMTAYQYAKVKAQYSGVNKKGYPLLKASGVLEKSITEEGDANAIQNITKTSLEIGTKVEYGAFHQFGTRKMPMRPILFIDPTTTGLAPSSTLARRQVAWTKAIERFVNRTLGIKGGDDGR